MFLVLTRKNIALYIQLCSFTGMGYKLQHQGEGRFKKIKLMEGNAKYFEVIAEFGGTENYREA
jgi:hypothetical protein